MARQEPSYATGLERWGWGPAWLIFLLASIVYFVFGLGDAAGGAATFGQAEAPTYEGITGTTWEVSKSSPAALFLDFAVRLYSIGGLLTPALTALISATAFRRGDRWAWFAMALWPVQIVASSLYLFAFIKYSTSATPPPLWFGAGLVVLMLIALGLTFRRAFGLVQNVTGSTW